MKDRRRRKWRTQISVGGKKIYLGQFTDEIDAAKAYDDAAKKYHGEFACLNFPDPEKSYPQIRLRLRAWVCSLIRLIKAHRQLIRLILSEYACNKLCSRLLAAIPKPFALEAATQGTPAKTHIGGLSKKSKFTTKGGTAKLVWPCPDRGEPRAAAKSNPNNIPSSERFDDHFNLLAWARKASKPPITTIWGHFSPRKTMPTRSFRAAPVLAHALAQSRHHPSRAHRHNPIRPP